MEWWSSSLSSLGLSYEKCWIFVIYIYYCQVEASRGKATSVLIFSLGLSWQSAALSSTTQHAMPVDFRGKGVTGWLNTKFPLPDKYILNIIKSNSCCLLYNLKYSCNQTIRRGYKVRNKTYLEHDRHVSDWRICKWVINLLYYMNKWSKITCRILCM